MPAASCIWYMMQNADFVTRKGKNFHGLCLRAPPQAYTIWIISYDGHIIGYKNETEKNFLEGRSPGPGGLRFPRGFLGKQVVRVVLAKQRAGVSKFRICKIRPSRQLALQGLFSDSQDLRILFDRDSLLLQRRPQIVKHILISSLPLRVTSYFNIYPQS